MRTKAIKYLFPLVLFALAVVSFYFSGILTWSLFIFVWIVVPLWELQTPPNPVNLLRSEEEVIKDDRTYDYILYMVVPLQFGCLYYFLELMQSASTASWWETFGRIQAMGLLCGIFGINAAHELGHRVHTYERVLSKALLLTSIYHHFYIEHNKGHHKNVATELDPASARYNEPVYKFYFRTIIYSYISAWKIANREMRAKGLPAFHWKNEMIQGQLLQTAFVAVIVFFYGWLVTAYFVCASLLGILLLETVNYIEHYGLQRKETDKGYERALPQHSWNSNHLIGRVALFELGRHSDHHYMASRKYQILRHHREAPQLPTGYPGSMLMALVPPVWFKVMNRRIDKYKKHIESIPHDALASKIRLQSMG